MKILINRKILTGNLQELIQAVKQLPQPEIKKLSIEEFKQILANHEEKSAESAIDNNKNAQEEMIALSPIVKINTGEAYYMDAKTPNHILCSVDTSTCLQVAIFNRSAELLILHFNTAFVIDWQEIFTKFKDKKLQVCLLGSATLPGGKGENNIT